MCSCAHGITPADPNLQEAAAAWEWTHHRVWRLCTLEEVQNRYMCDLSSMVGTSLYFLVLWGQQMQCFTPGEDSSLFWQDAVLVLNSAPVWVSTWFLFSTWLVEVINYFPVQEPVVLLSQNAKKKQAASWWRGKARCGTSCHWVPSASPVQVSCAWNLKQLSPKLTLGLD